MGINKQFIILVIFCNIIIHSDCYNSINDGHNRTLVNNVTTIINNNTISNNDNSNNTTNNNISHKLLTILVHSSPTSLESNATDNEVQLRLAHVIHQELQLPNNTDCHEVIRDELQHITIVTKKKSAANVLLYQPTDWTRCTRSCVIRRSWTCRYDEELCAGLGYIEEAWCYVAGSKCEKKVMEEVQHVPGDNYEDHTTTADYYDYYADVTSTTSHDSDITHYDDSHYLYVLADDYVTSNVDVDYYEYNDDVISRTVDDAATTIADYDIDVDQVKLSRPLKPGEGKCGFSKVKLHHDFLRVIGGHEAPRGALPWHVAVLNRFKEVFCGGALIAPNWILTAAHCVRKKLFVRVAEHDIRAYDDGEVEIKVLKSFSHPLYRRETIDNDIALLKLPENVKFTKYIKTVCLPSINQGPPRNKKCIVAGWGKEKETHIFGSDVLLYAQVPINTKKLCKNSYPDHPISKNMFCAGYKKGGRDTCSGDSGGPLICKNDKNQWTVHGVTSFGEGCGDKGKMGVYSKVNNVLPWIYHTMDNN